MPELSNIQTYEKVDNSTFKLTLKRFSRVLKNIDLWNDEIKSAFDTFEWKVEDDGFIYSTITQPGFYISKLSDVKIRPLLMVYSPAIDNTFNDYWICCELLIEAENLRSFEKGEFYNYTYNLIKSLISEMHKEFKQTGVYFTDEAQDGNDFDGVRCNDVKKLWHFDYAIIPNSLIELYSEIPATHCIKQYYSYFESWYTDRWKPSH